MEPAPVLTLCPMCGEEYDPQENVACPSCPIQRSCTLSCCPNCGYETVDPGRSKLAGFLQKIGGLASRSNRGSTTAP